MNWFMNLSTKGKLVLGFGIVILCLLVVIITATITVTDLNKTTKDIHSNEYTKAMDIMMVRVHLNAMRTDLFQMLATDDALLQQEMEADIQARNQEVAMIVGQLLATETDPDILSAIRIFRDQLTTYTDTRDNTQIPLIKEGKSSEALALASDIQEERSQKLFSELDNLVVLHTEELNTAVLNSETLAYKAILFFIVIGLIGFLVAAGMILILTRTIALPMVALSKAAQQGADGDLTVEIPANSRTDEVGILMTSFRAMLMNFHTSNREVQEGVTTLSSTASELMAASSQSAGTMQETATAIAQTTATVEEVQQTTQVSNDRAKAVADNAQRVSVVAKEGAMSVNENIRAMNTIKEHVDQIAENIVRLSEQSQAIGEINGAMSDIADQSNLLAVNAAIEAAKSGEEGKGFTVVADEVRNLADQSKQATVKVQKILADIQKSMNASVMAAEQGTKSVEAGILQANTAGEAIQSLAQSVEEASKSAIQIAAAGQQQMVGMDQVASAMENIKQASAQNLVAVQQTEEAVRTLHEIGVKLKMDVDRYRV